MREIDTKDLCKVINPLGMEDSPAIALACDGQRTNGLTIGWATFGVLWGQMCATVFIHKNRYSKEIFDNSDRFSICFVDDKEALRYFGRVSGRDEDKIANTSLTCETVDSVPVFSESRVVIICSKMGQSDFDVKCVPPQVKAWYEKDGVHTQYYGRIEKVLVSQ